MASRSCLLRQRECTLHGQDHLHLLLSHPVVPGGRACAPGSVCRVVWLCLTSTGTWNLYGTFSMTASGGGRGSQGACRDEKSVGHIWSSSDQTLPLGVACTEHKPKSAPGCMGWISAEVRKSACKLQVCRLRRLPLTQHSGTHTPRQPSLTYLLALNWIQADLVFQLPELARLTLVPEDQGKHVQAVLLTNLGG